MGEGGEKQNNVTAKKEDRKKESERERKRAERNEVAPTARKEDEMKKR